MEKGRTDINSNFAGLKFVNATTQANTAKEFGVSASFRGILFTIDSDATRCGEYMIYSGATQFVRTVAVKSATNVTFDVATAGRMSITTPGSTKLVFIVATGNITAL